ncbi:efflux RND transporter periplasmic adaptor subunit [Quisquiliibacterium transsilvanicum]|uniref:Cobalt-zinc-cadmium efflux system membrane fusion protein n=1 Tax=Quisquiliibacterium transsilvanicum TaxID=1549638 RepID=A0A7W8MAH0_9BURK|nr:efflux RND transporter periplasmic adaptor subunit [Quisquiliibacterium transsilvanicum]MBB5273355.1 cobalt-zinc-cadmium efflux system membrane fusion protein [Quisquiliibacterium transsilvanicum]
MTIQGIRPLLLAAALLGLTACGERAAPPSAASAARPDPMEIALDDSTRSRVSTAAVGTSTVMETVRIAGRIEVNQYRTARIGAPITGRISQIDAELGQRVRAGQVLAEINSPELAQAQLAFLRANSQQQQLTRAVERAQLLLAADVIGSAELQRRQTELTVFSAEKRAVSDQLRALGLSRERIRRLEETGQIQQTASITATLSGTLIDRQVAQGQVVSPSDVLFVVSDLGSVWAVAEVPEQDARFVTRGQKVRLEVPALDNQQLEASVQYVADIVDPQTRTVRVGAVLENRDQRLKPSMLMTMLVQGRSSERQVVPSSAVVRENDVDHVFVLVRDDAFRLTPVTLEPERDGVRPLARPLPEGARIAIDGAFHLNNARMQRALAGN